MYTLIVWDQNNERHRIMFSDFGDAVLKAQESFDLGAEYAVVTNHLGREVFVAEEQ